MFTFPQELIPFINPILIIWVLVEIYFGYKNGLVIQLLNLIGTFVSFIIAWLLAPVFATVFSFMQTKGSGIFTIEQTVYAEINKLIWVVILFLVIKVTLWILTPMVKFITKIPLIKQVNSLAGAVGSIGFVFIKAMVLCFVLTFPLITNGQEMIQKSALNYVAVVATPVEDLISTTLNTNLGLQSILENQSLSPDQQKTMVEWLENNGFTQKEIEGYLNTYGKGN